MVCIGITITNTKTYKLMRGALNMHNCRNCGKQGENFLNFGTKYHYCSEECYEASYILVTTIPELYNAIQGRDKDIVVEGALASQVIIIKKTPIRVMEYYNKLLNLMGFKDMDKPYEGDISEAEKKVIKYLSEPEHKESKFSYGVGMCAQVDSGEPVDSSTMTTVTGWQIVAIILGLGLYLCYAIHKDYELEIEVDGSKGKGKAVLRPKNKN